MFIKAGNASNYTQSRRKNQSEFMVHKVFSRERIDAYFDCLISRKCSPLTVEQKEYQLGKILKWLDENKIDTADLTAFERYKTHLNSKFLPSTVFMQIAWLKAFFTFQVKRHYLKVSPLADLENKKPPKPKKAKGPSLHELRSRLRAVCKTDRDRFLVEIFTRTGMRACEVAGLKWEHLKVYRYDDAPSDGDFIFQGKGNRPRQVPVSPEFLKILKANKNGSPFVVYSTKNQARGINAHTLAQHTNILYKRAGIDGSSHMARSIVITHIAAVDGIDAAQEQAGHADIKTTLGYLRDDPKRRRKRGRLLD